MGVEPAGLLDWVGLENVGPADRLELSFAPRANLFTGDNGLGKSFLLEVAWWALIGAWPGKPAMARSDHAAGVLQCRRGQESSPYRQVVGKRPARREKSASDADIGIFIAANGDATVHVDGGDLDVVPNESGSDFDVYGGEKNFNIPFSEIFDGLKQPSKRKLFQGLIAEWVPWQYKKDPDFDIFRKLIAQLSPEREPIRLGEPKRIDARDGRLIPCLILPYGDVPITHASAGMRRIVALAYLMVWAVREHRFLSGKSSSKPINLALFIDEIEAHLHPAWQRLILPALMKALEALPVPVKAQIFVTTHSPMVMASTETLCADPDDGLFLFDLDAGKVRLTRQPWEKYGDASAWLQSDLFGLGEARSKPAEELIADIAAVMDFNQLTDEQFRRLDARVAQLLPEQDPMRARWIVWKMKRSGQL